ncbi:MAG: TetR/AcrR family transcriptional regulator [Polyangiaceae bacterium]
MAASLATAEAATAARAEILRAAAHAVAEHGFHGMSMRELAKATGRSPASFYNYFSSKEAVLLAIQSEAFEVLLAAAEGVLSQFTDPRERLYAFVLNHVQYFAKHGDVMRVLIHEANSLAPESRAKVGSLKRRYFQLARDLVEKHVAPDTRAAEVERITYCLFGMLNWIYGWYQPKQHGAPSLVARSIFSVAEGGLGAAHSRDESLNKVERELSGMNAPELLASTKEIRT